MAVRMRRKWVYSVTCPSGLAIWNAEFPIYWPTRFPISSVHFPECIY